MDDAADDLELARVIRAMDEDEAVGATWSRYHLVSAVLRGNDPATLEVREQVDISFETAGDGPEAEHEPTTVIEEAPPVPAEGGHGMPAWMSFAAAATVTLAVVIGFQWPRGEAGAPVVASVPVEDLGPVRTDPRAIRSAGRDGTTPEVLRPGQLRLGPVDLPLGTTRAASAAERQVDAYMLYHAEFSAANSASGIVPFARYAAFEGGR
jgi:sigma-E factor negative regulatory protein RseA